MIGKILSLYVWCVSLALFVMGTAAILALGPFLGYDSKTQLEKLQKKWWARSKKILTKGGWI